MRLIALALTVPPLIAALLVAALIATAMPARAGQATATDRATLIEACMREIRAGQKAGQTMTNGQRMIAEEQCRARAEAALQAPQTRPAR